jgi:hypothetical protein
VIGRTPMEDPSRRWLPLILAKSSLAVKGARRNSSAHKHQSQHNSDGHCERCFDDDVSQLLVTDSGRTVLSPRSSTA